MFNFFDLFNFDIGIDPGSYKTRATNGGTVEFNDFTYLTFNLINKSVVAYGGNSKEMVGRVPKGMEVVKPIQNSEIVTNNYYEMYIRNIFEHFAKRDKTLRFKTKPRVLLALPLDYTQSSLNNFEESMKKSGASDTIFLPKSVVASFGLSNKSSRERIKLIIDIGYQKTEISAVYKDGIYEGKTIDFGGEMIDRHILNKLIDEKRVQCSLNNIEKYKEECLMFQPFEQENEKFKVVGKDTKKGGPVTVELSCLELREIVIPLIRSELLKQIKLFLNSLNDRIIGDLFEEGIYLIGGSARNRTLSRFLSKELGIKFNDIKDPELVTSKGLKNIMKNNDLIEKIRIK
jgi:rod shape-determining protein MreB